MFDTNFNKKRVAEATKNKVKYAIYIIRLKRYKINMTR